MMIITIQQTFSSLVPQPPSSLKKYDCSFFLYVWFNLVLLKNHLKVAESLKYFNIDLKIRIFSYIDIYIPRCLRKMNNIN